MARYTTVISQLGTKYFWSLCHKGKPIATSKIIGTKEEVEKEVGEITRTFAIENFIEERG